MALVTPSTVTIPSFTGFKLAVISKPSSISTTTKVMPKLAVRSSLKDFGIMVVATTTSFALVGNAMAIEILLGSDDGGLVFVPSEFTVAKGEKIVFKNNAGFPHNAVFDEDEIPSGVDVSKISMGEQDLLNGTGEIYEVTLNVPGTYGFTVCRIKVLVWLGKSPLTDMLNLS